MVEKINQNQIKILRALLKLNRRITRKELLQVLTPSYPKLTQDYIKEIIGRSVKSMGGFIEVNYKELDGTAGRPSELLNITDAGKMAISAFELANENV